MKKEKKEEKDKSPFKDRTSLEFKEFAKQA